MEYFLEHLFTGTGLPKMYSTATYPLDIASMTEAVALFHVLDQHRVVDDPAVVQRVAETWLQTARHGVKLLQDRDGSFAARYYPPLRMNLHSLRWGGGQALGALAQTLQWLGQERHA